MRIDRHYLWKRLDDGRGHDEVAADLRAHGFQLDKFAARLAKRIREPEFRNDGDPVDPEWNCNDAIAELLDGSYLRPDAFRIRIEGPQHGWGRSVLACDVVEVIHSNEPSEQKLAFYHLLWSLADHAERLSFRFWHTTHGRTFHPITPTHSTSWGQPVWPDGQISFDELIHFTVPA